jgi:hypothetical protein
MKKAFLQGLLFLLAIQLQAQSTGDTIVIKAFKYGSGSRDTMINFPNNNLTFEKIIMKYNMRCKNGLVSTQSAPNDIGCGEWDYSCNTYIVDSTKIENALNTAPNYVITNYTGNLFPYTTVPLFDYYNFAQNTVTLNNIVSESQYTIGTSAVSAPNVLKTNERSGRSQLLFTASELSGAGLTAGNIDGFLLNVTNAGGVANFLKVGIQQTNANALSASSPTLTGFTNVYNSNYIFTAGSNRVQFYTPFVWNGTSNILIDLSFTNTNPSTPIVFGGSAATSTMALYSKNNYAVDLSALGHVVLNATPLSSISTEVTVAFWAFGKSSQLPANTQLFYGYDNDPNHRQLSLQLPWGDNNMYFDCGYSNGGYDRVNKVSNASEQGGQWNHWAVTKNANTGAMTIYLNGVLWQSGTNKVKAISVLNMILGKDQNFLNNWKGRLNEFTIWNKELSVSDIQAWMNKQIDASHPYYSNLVAYYKFDEGTGLAVADSKNSLTVNGYNLQWSYDRGNALTRSFSETGVRPKITFVRGNYNLTTATVTVKDSVQRNPNIVTQYSITSNATVTPVIDDVVTPMNTNFYYGATPLNIYNGDTGVLTGTLAVTAQNTITVTNLNYFRRFPYYNELMSFVTPYGLSLNLGATGKSWYFDVTDFTPILKGPKRLVMTLGGERQEQMDLDFLFIVGTPPRNILSFNQLWQGAARAGGAPIGQINNDTRFPPIAVAMNNGAQAFKLRSTITGHGSQGEFGQNGGVVNHYFNVNGGANEFTWQITTECGDNPIFPQGGTWVIDRQGWCPGRASLLKEFNLTPYLTAGATATLDYNCSNPQVTTGDYRYIVANQLITYAGANNSLDARITDVLKPSDKVVYSRSNPICSTPVIIVQNSGSTPITSLSINYWVNNASVKENYIWTGNLAFMDTAMVSLPIGNLWQGVLPGTTNRFYAEVSKANNAVDQYSFNNTYSSTFKAPISIANEFIIEVKTNNTLEDSYTIEDDQGNVVAQSNFSSPNTTYSDSYNFLGCYKLKVVDTGGDGISWWANTGQGVGSIVLKKITGGAIKTFEPDFGSGFEFSFTTYDPTLVGTNDLGAHLNLYPNPARGKFVLEGSDMENSTVKIADILGKQVDMPMVKTGGKFEFITTNVVPGMYLVTISKGNESITRKVMVN